jgi:hypothetical protein
MKKSIIFVLLAILIVACSALPQSSSKVLFKDDFSSSRSGWNTRHESEAITDYENGAYRIQINTTGSGGAGMSYWANPKLGDQLPSDVSIEVDATKNRGPDDNDFGVMCRYTMKNSDPSFYQFMVTSDGYLGIMLVSGGDQQMLTSEDVQTSEAIKQGAALNHLRADCIGDSLTLYINGQKVANVTDSTLTKGDVGLIAGTYSKPGTDILFDNFVVSKP